MCCFQQNKIAPFIAKYARAVYRELALVTGALAAEPAAVFSKAYRNRHALASSSTVNTALRRLLAESTIECDSDIYRLANPLLAHHLAQQV